MLTLRGFSTPQPGNDAIAMAAQYQWSQFGGFAFELSPGEWAAVLNGELYIAYRRYDA